MASRVSGGGRPSTTYYGDLTSHASRPTTSRSRTGQRPRTGASSVGVQHGQEIICALSESRGVSPTVGLAFINLTTAEAVLSQICDNQTYVRTVTKINCFNPSQILVMNTAMNPESKMVSIVEENVGYAQLISLDRRYWAETAGLEYITHLAFVEDVEAIRVSVGGNYFATCCFAAALKYIELGLSTTFVFHSLRISFQPSEGTMMIDLSTIQSLELIQNLQNARSSDCLFGLLNETLTPMGSRNLRSNILQPSTERHKLKERFDALEELTSKEEMFFATRQALKPFLDVDKVLAALIVIKTDESLFFSEQSINNVIKLKHFVNAVVPLYEALAGARSPLLQSIRNLCAPHKVEAVQELIQETINNDVTYQSQPLDLKNQRTYAVKAGVNGLLDVSRQTFKEATDDVYQLAEDLRRE
ncbi:MAG: MutS protein msh4 [Sclerophora amabilis]|nr:MAG: MutS protein msh4 [Sclerophora amabilis]